jgi:hypothetical protein
MYRIPDTQLEKRFAAWRELRQHLENSTTPFDDVVEFFNHFPHVKVYTDPYDQSTWPTAWQLIEENEYCPFNMLLAVCYTLQLCTRFEKFNPKITVSVDKLSNSVYYMLFIDKLVYGFEDGVWTPIENLPKSLKNIKIYPMPPLH